MRFFLPVCPAGALAGGRHVGQTGNGMRGPEEPESAPVDQKEW